MWMEAGGGRPEIAMMLCQPIVGRCVVPSYSLQCPHLACLRVENAMRKAGRKDLLTLEAQENVRLSGPAHAPEAGPQKPRPCSAPVHSPIVIEKGAQCGGSREDEDLAEAGVSSKGAVRQGDHVLHCAKQVFQRFSRKGVTSWIVSAWWSLPVSPQRAGRPHVANEQHIGRTRWMCTAPIPAQHGGGMCAV